MSSAFVKGKFTTSDFKKGRKRENTNQLRHQFTMFINHFYNLTATSTVHWHQQNYWMFVVIFHVHLSIIFAGGQTQSLYTNFTSQRTIFQGLLVICYMWFALLNMHLKPDKNKCTLTRQIRFKCIDSFSRFRKNVVDGLLGLWAIGFLWVQTVTY